VTPARAEDGPGVRRAWGWVAHLRAGGSTAWADWTVEGEARGRLLPGAQQLELLRRLNAAGDVSATLAERVLGASAPGRGRPDLELLGAVEPLAFGPAPVDPGELPADELVRVAAGLLAEDVVAAGPPPAHDPLLVRPWRTRYRLAGDPGLADPAREELTARGRPPGGRNAVVLVLGTDLPRMMVDTWAARCVDDPVPAWESWCARARRRDRLPPRVDLALAARTAAGRVGAARVHVVLDPASLPRLTGVRRLHPPAALADELGADGLELARRVSAVLGLLVVPERRRALLRRTLVPRLAALPAVRTGPRLAVPARHQDWLQRRADRMREELSRGGYAVHGDLDVLLPTRADGSVGAGTPSAAGTLTLAVRLLLGSPDRAWTGPAGGPHPGADSDKERT
jgi:hypothetical protein